MSFAPPWYRVRRRSDGRYQLRLPPVEQAVLAQLPEALVATLEAAKAGAGAAPEAVRLFPPAYPDDAEAERSYRELMQHELVEHHRAALETVAATIGKKILDDEEAACWLGALNDVRLVLGTTLGVDEEIPPVLAGEVDEARYSLYRYLSVLVEQLVSAMSGALPTAVDGADDLAPDDPWGDPPDGLRWSAPGAPATSESVRAPRWPARPRPAEGEVTGAGGEVPGSGGEPDEQPPAG